MSGSSLDGLEPLNARIANLERIVAGQHAVIVANAEFLATAGTVIPVAGLAQALVTRFGARPVLTIGFVLQTAGMLWYTQIPTHGSFWSALLPGYLFVGFGLAFSFIPLSIAALAGVAPQEAGLASGLINTTQQIGGALGVAVASTVAFTHASALLKSGHSQAVAATSGFSLGFWVLAGISAASVVASFMLVRGREVSAESLTAAA